MLSLFQRKEPHRPIFSTADSFEAMRTALMTHKAFVVRGAADKGLIDNLASTAEYAYAKWDRRIHDFNDSESSAFHEGHIPSIDLGIERLSSLGNKGYFAELRREVFRWPSALSEPDFLLRRILPLRLRSRYVKKKIAFHQDEYFSLISGGQPNQLCFTAWIPLVACGKDAPGLSVVVGSDLPILMGEPAAGWNKHIRTNYGPGALWSPELDAGDVFVFTNRAIHGSYVRWNMTKPRYSLEIRGGIN